MPNYGKIRGAIRWYSSLLELRKPIFASIYSRLLLWANAVDRGFGGRYSRYFAGGFALRRCRNSISRYSAAPKCEFRSRFPLLPLDRNTSIIGALTWCFISENAASSHLHTFFWYPKCTQYGWQGFEQVNYSSFLRTFLSQFFLKLLRAPKNRSSVLVASFASNFKAVSSIVQMKSAACASL